MSPLKACVSLDLGTPSNKKPREISYT